ncbi:MAG: PrsW family glutamic-type intramembrane protease [Armatimonadota bacterium]|nr:PrsW family glutamic-type intramembrane protease [Armatimonadota bacterium]
MSGTGLLVTAVLVTVVPVLIYLWILWRVDRYEKEPVTLLAVALAGGAVVAPLLTALAQSVLGIPTSIFPALFQIYPFAHPNLAGAVVEELAKGAVILTVYVLVPHEFDNTLDGVVYGATVGAGFALAESVVYLSDLASLAAAANLEAGFFGAILVSGLTHCVFGAIFGAALGYVREASPSGGARWWIPIAGLAAAALYHAGYVAVGAAGLAGVGGLTGLLLGLGRRLADVGGLVLVGVIVAWAWSRERGVLRWALATEAPEVIAPDELEALAQGRMTGDPRLREALAELAFAKWRLARGFGTQEGVTRQRERVRQVRLAQGGSRG